MALCPMVAGAGVPVLPQNYPLKPVRLVVGFPPGGGADGAARVVAQKLQEMWKQSVVVDNRAGAGGNLAAEIVTKADADGHTLLLSSPGPVAINPSLMASLPYNPRTQLAPITLVAMAPNVLVVHPSSAAMSLKEFIAVAKNSANRLNYGSSGPGSTPHLSAELLRMMAKIDLTHVPYKGAGPAVIDLVAGRIDLMVVSVPTVLNLVRTQRIRALAVTTLTRSSAMPELPTFNEAGLPGYEAGVWWGLLVPAGTPPAIIDKLYQAVATVLRMPETTARTAAEGAEVVGTTPKALGEFIQKETAKWAAVIKTAGIKAD